MDGTDNKVDLFTEGQEKVAMLERSVTLKRNIVVSLNSHKQVIEEAPTPDKLIIEADLELHKKDRSGLL